MTKRANDTGCRWPQCPSGSNRLCWLLSLPLVTLPTLYSLTPDCSPAHACNRGLEQAAVCAGM